ncbi:MAG: magnesium chelatase ATPase subunit D, partial [Methylobacteriaceae bacterium]
MAPEPDDPAGVWNDALRAANLFAADPHGLGGIVLRAGAGPVRDLWLDHLRDRLTGPVRRMPPGIADDRLIGGLDLPATLRAGRPVIQRGLLAEADGGVVVVPMAERLERGTVARLAGALDTGMLVLERDGLAARLPARFGLVLLDEGQEDETVAEALADRLALRLDLSGVSLRDVRAAPSHTARGADAAAGPPAPDATATLCAVAEAFGIASLRAPLLALRIARLIAGEAGRDEPSETDLIEAARLVLAPRATRLPAPRQPAEPEPADPPPPEP